MMIGRFWQRLKNLVVRRILGLEDTPHRIAWGVFLGLLIAMTPTLGFQIMLYVAIATVLRANKVSGVPLLFISNPFTAAPLYYGVWWVGSIALHGTTDPDGADEVGRRLREAEAEAAFGWSDLATLEFWERIGALLWSMGAELWFGALVVGIATGVPGYFLTRVGVLQYRKARGKL